jgi:hypothetical protein
MLRFAALNISRFTLARVIRHSDCRPLLRTISKQNEPIPTNDNKEGPSFATSDIKSTHDVEKVMPDAKVGHHYWEATRNLLYEYEKKLKYRGYNTLRISLGLLMGSILVMYLFGKQIKGFFSAHGADVASQSLSNTNFQISASDFSKNVVHQLLGDPEVSDLAVQFLSDLVKRPDTRRVLSDLVVAVLQDESTKQQVSKLAREQVAWYLLNDPQTIENVVAMITRIIIRDETLQSANELVHKIIQDTSVQNQVSQLFANVIVTDIVKLKAQDLGTHTVRQVLEDENIKEHATSFVRAVLMDQHIQHDAGYALWEALKVSLTPRWFVRTTATTTEEDIEQNNTQTDTDHHNNTRHIHDEHPCMPVKPTVDT